MRTSCFAVSHRLSASLAGWVSNKVITSIRWSNPNYNNSVILVIALNMT